MKRLLLASLFALLGVILATEGAMAMVNLPGHIPEPLKMMLFGFSLIALASFGQQSFSKR
jgi:hypothetical protein